MILELIGAVTLFDALFDGKASKEQQPTQNDPLSGGAMRAKSHTICRNLLEDVYDLAPYQAYSEMRDAKKMSCEEYCKRTIKGLHRGNLEHIWEMCNEN